MGKDGLIPSLFARLHPQFKTPAAGTLTVCAISAVFAAFLPISILGDLVSLGTAIAFAIVAFALIWLRNRHPDLPRPFRVPLGGFTVGKVWIGYVPLLAIVGCLSMVVPVVADVSLQAAHGDVLPAAIIGIYIALGVLIYVFYGRHNAVAPEDQA
jgi:APA family basic amino acid/polyamine antiporter